MIVMTEASRLGRYKPMTALILNQIIKANVAVWYSLKAEQLNFDSPMDRLVVDIFATMAEMESVNTGLRVRNVLQGKAAAGFCAGGACFGYDLVPVNAKGVNGEQVRSHTDYAINEEQAETIRGVFRAYADGHGHTVIAKALNGNDGYGPKAKRGTGSWAPSNIREILYRVRYTGKVPFGETMTERPDLRIVDAELWERVQQRLREVKATYIRDGAQWWGRPSAEKYLLSGMGKCNGCGKAITVLYHQNGSPPRREKVHYYGCS